jgi:uncharacterized protein YPO0396
MGLWEKVQRELDRAGESAKNALDEGKTRIEIFRVRQQADKAAQALGYAIHRAKRDGKELEADVRDRLEKKLADHEAEAKRLEEELAKVLTTAKGSDEPAPAAAEPPSTPT